MRINGRIVYTFLHAMDSSLLYVINFFCLLMTFTLQQHGAWMLKWGHGLTNTMCCVV